RGLRRRGAALARGEQSSIRRPANVVDAESNRHRISFERCLSSRKTDQRLTAPPADVQRLAVLRNFEAVRTCSLPARNFLPSAAGVPLPQLTIVLTGHHPATRRRVLSAR